MVILGKNKTEYKETRYPVPTSPRTLKIITKDMCDGKVSIVT